MAGTNGRQAVGERVLESRHLVGLFLGVVLLCGVFFTLGYVMGKTQYGTTQVANAASPVLPSPKQQAVTPTPANTSAPAPPAPNTDWDFYEKDKQPPHLDPKPSAASNAGPPNSISPRPAGSASPAVTSKPAPVSAASKEPPRYQPPILAKGAIVLQLAALKREGDAIALADAVQQKRFPSFVVTSPADSLFRVQVGPYADLQAANAAKESLAHAGFNSIIKR
jgi:DedD protein